MRRTDEDILDGFNNNKEWAYEAIFKMYYIEMLNFSFSIIGIRQDAEEAVMSAFQILFSIQKKNFLFINAIKKYLIIAVKWKSKNKRNRTWITDSHYRDYINQYNESEEIEIDFELFHIRSEVVNKIWAIIDGMPEKRKNIIKMMFIDEKDAIEIAKELGITAQTVYAQKSRALLEIKNTIKNEFGNNSTPVNSD